MNDCKDISPRQLGKGGGCGSIQVSLSIRDAIRDRERDGVGDLRGKTNCSGPARRLRVCSARAGTPFVQRRGRT
jgi:hypothetical protein